MPRSRIASSISEIVDCSNLCGVGHRLKKLGSIRFTCFRYVKLRQMTPTMCCHGDFTCSCTIKSSLILFDWIVWPFVIKGFLQVLLVLFLGHVVKPSAVSARRPATSARDELFSQVSFLIHLYLRISFPWPSRSCACLSHAVVSNRHPPE